MNATTLSIAALLLGISCLAGCRSPLLGRDKKNDTAASTSTLVIVIGSATAASGGAKTLVPNTGGLVVKYSILLVKGSTSSTISSSSSPITVAGLESGAWSIEASGYDASNRLLAQGSATTMVGADQAARVAVNLSFVQSGGTGSIEISLIFPHSAGVDAVNATLGGSAATAALGGDGTTDSVIVSQAKVAAGSPVLHVFLYKAGAIIAGVTESVWVLRNVTTAAIIDLRLEDFGSVPAAPTLASSECGHDGTILLRWDDTSVIADSYVLRRSAGADDDFRQVGPELPCDARSFSDSGLAASTTYHYRITAKNRFGESEALAMDQATPAVVDAPIISPSPGATVGESQSLSIACARAGASIYYASTADGSDPPVPSSVSTSYSGPISLEGCGSPFKIRVISVERGMIDSAPTATAVYTINRRPVIGAVSAVAQSLYRGQSVRLSVSAYDPENDALSYTYAFVSGSGTISGSGPSVQATVSSLGENAIAVTVRDSFGNQATSLQPLILTGVNRKPSGTIALSSETLYNDNSYSKTVTVSASDPDSADTLTYSFSVPTGLGSCSPSGATTAPSATYRPGTGAGLETIKVDISDGHETVSYTINATVYGWSAIAYRSSTQPTARQGAAVASRGDDASLFGGKTLSDGMPQSDSLYYQCNVRQWSDMTQAAMPPSRSGATLVCFDNSDVGGNLLFGGNDGVSALSDLWLEGNGFTWTRLTFPPAVSPPAMEAVDAVSDGDGVSYIFGSDGYVYMACLPTINRTTTVASLFKLQPAYSPPPRSGYCAIWDGTGVVIFGGRSGSADRNDVWRFTPPAVANLASSPTVSGTGIWTNLFPDSAGASASRPSQRFGQSAIRDGNNNLIVFGGNAGGTAMNDLWRFNLLNSAYTWSAMPSLNGPSGRYGHKTVYYDNGTEKQMLVFGTLTAGDSVGWQYRMP